MDRNGERYELGCWYPVEGVERLCRRPVMDSPSGLCPDHKLALIAPRGSLLVDSIIGRG